MGNIIVLARSWWRRLWDMPQQPPRVESQSGHAYSARAQLSRIEWKLDRLGWHLTRLHLIWPTSGPTESICRFSTGTSTQPPPRQEAPPPSTAASPRSRHGLRLLKWLPKIAGWLAEKLIQYLWPAIGGLLLSLWALLKHYGDTIWQYVLGCWHWLLG